MRIAMISDSFLPRAGGIELHLRDLSAQLAEAGHDVHIISPFAGDGPVQGVTVQHLRVALWPRFQFAWTPAAVYRLEGCLRDGAFDVVHHHMSIFSPLTVASICQCLQLRIPAVVTGHSLWRGYARALGWLDNMLSWSATPLVISAVSEAVAADIAPFTGANRVELLPNGIDTHFWKRAATPGVNNGVLHVISVLRLARRKRPRVLLDIAERLLQELPSSVSFHWQIIGDGNERALLEHMIRSRGLSEHVELLGFRTRTEIRSLFENQHVFVLPTAEEAFGIAALEARSAGLPVVAMATGGVGEIIRHGVEGLLAATDRELVTHVATLLTNTALRERITMHNRETNPRDTWPHVIARHERVYGLARQRMSTYAASGS